MGVERLQAAYEQGDIEALRAELGHPEEFPNIRDECGCWCLEYALYHAPLPLVKKLLELGANPNYPDSGGFPSLFAALDSNQADRGDRLTLLLNYGADIQQRGINDYTPLHYAATHNDGEAVSLLLARGADPTERTRIDHYATALEEAEYFGHRIGAEALRRSGVTV